MTMLSIDARAGQSQVPDKCMGRVITTLEELNRFEANSYDIALCQRSDPALRRRPLGK
jgi:hypothetical protein